MQPTAYTCLKWLEESQPVGCWGVLSSSLGEEALQAREYVLGLPVDAAGGGASETTQGTQIPKLSLVVLSKGACDFD